MASFNGVGFDLRNVRAIDDAIVREVQFTDGVLRGCALTYAGANITIARGAYIFKGREIAVDGITTITTSPTYTNGYGRLKYVIDLSQAASDTTFTQGSTVMEYAATNSFSALTQQDINDGTSTLYEVEICRVQYTSGSITSVVSEIGAATNNQGITPSQIGAASATDMATANTNITALQNKDRTLFTDGTPPNYTASDSSVTSLEDGLMRIIVFHAFSDGATTLNINGLGAKPLYTSYGVHFKPKWIQFVKVVYSAWDNCFFVVSPGGGVEFPATPAAGNTNILVHNAMYEFGALGLTYVAAPFYGFTVKIAGVYRVTYRAAATKANTGSSYEFYVKLQKNGVDVSGSETITTPANYTMTDVVKTMDLSLAVNDVIRVLVHRSDNACYGGLYALAATLLAADVQAELDKYLTQVST